MMLFNNTGKLARHARPEEEPPPVLPAQVVLSFDVEEHYRIEAAAGMAIPADQKAHYRGRLNVSTRWVLEQLDKRAIRATFFVVGKIARHSPALVRAIHQAGHEVASHGWDHRRLHGLTPASFRQDLRQSKDALEQITGAAVLGYRAPTFSLVRQTAWAVPILAETGLLYDSSIYPVRHDRYGVPQAPRSPFRVRGQGREILELPPATVRLLGANAPAGGGGYFRLLPLVVLEHALAQVKHSCRPPVAVLYFHPWEFDTVQARLPLSYLSRLRTYVGIGRTRSRLATLLSRHRFSRAVDVAKLLDAQLAALPSYDLASGQDETP
jgi:polysaccharide deacetylase family protein (PEP-CTERM system associated)